MTLAAGSRLGPYEVLAPLGAGGMGEVYRARDTRLAREVAIKVLPQALASDQERLRRFEKEAKSASALNHPNIVTIHDIGSDGGVSYIAMELVDGTTLRELLASGPLPVKRLLQIAPQIADGLARAHEAGIVHRDLKPENVMMKKDGLVKILDFGLAKLTGPVSGSDSDSKLPTLTGTSPGIILGTVGYMSPEQASGRGVDFRSDQFAFGSILFEMVTGTRPFQKKTAIDTLAAILNEEPTPITSSAPQTPAPLRWIVERCLAKEPGERYASTEDLARDLASVRDHLSEASLSGQAAIAPISARRRNLRWLLLAAANLALLAAVFILAKRTAEKPPPSFQRMTFRHGSVGSARFAPDGRTVIYGAAWDGEPLRLFSTRTESRESTRFELPKADIVSLSSSGEMLMLLGRAVGSIGPYSFTLARAPLAGGGAREILENVTAADWSPDGQRLAVVRKAGNRYRIEFPIGKVLYETGDRMRALRFSPKGDRLAFMAADFISPRHQVSIQLLDLLGKRTVLSGGWSVGTQDLAWSPEGDEVWFGASKSGIYDAAASAVNMSGRQRLLLPLPGWITVHDTTRDGRALISVTSIRESTIGSSNGSPERDLSWLGGSEVFDITPDGKTILFIEIGQEGGGVYVRGMDGSPARRIGEGYPYAMSPDGRWAAIIRPGNRRQLMLVPTGAGEPRVLDLDIGFCWGASWFPNGKRLLLVGEKSGAAFRDFVTYVQDLDGGKPRAITPEGVQCGAISPDGKETACEDRKIYSIESGDPRPILGLEAEEGIYQWSSDGRSLFVGPDGVPLKIYRLDLATGRRELWREIRPPDRAGDIETFRMTPDGKSYAYSSQVLLGELYLVTGLR